MKKLLIALVTLALLTGGALSCRAVHFSCDVPKAAGGKEVPLSLRVDENSALYTAEFVLAFDENSYRFTGAFAPGSACEGLSPYLNVTQPGPGKVKIVYTATEPLTAGGALCTLGFRAVRGADQGVFELTVEHAETFDGERIRKLAFTASGTQGIIEPAASSVPLIMCAIAWVGVLLCAIVVIKKRKSKKKQED